MKRPWYIAIACASICLVTGRSAGDDSTTAHGPVVRLTNGEWVPWLSSDLPGGGAASQAVREAFATQGIEVQYGFFPWSRAYELARTGEWDGSVVWSRTPGREAEFLYSDAVLTGNNVFFYLRERTFDWSTVADLEGLTVGITVSYTYGPEFDKAVDAGLVTVDPAPSDELNFEKLLRGRIDLFPLDSLVGQHLLDSKFSAEERSRIVVHPRPIRSTSYHVIFPRAIESSAERVRQLNRGLTHMQESGRLQEVLTGRSGRTGLPAPANP